RGRRAGAPPRDARGRLSHAYRPGAARMRGFPPVVLVGALRVWRRNMESWRKYYRSSIVGALGEPILSLIAIGYGLGKFVNLGGVSYAQFLAPGILASAATNAASFEATFGSFPRTPQQQTYDGIRATQIRIR